MASLHSFASVLSPDLPSNSWNHLIYYLACSSGKEGAFDYETCADALWKRVPIDTAKERISFPATERVTFEQRFVTICGDNDAWYLAIKGMPTAKDLEAFARIKPCTSLLVPVRNYLADHPDVAREYRGFLPFTKEVRVFWDSIWRDWDLRYPGCEYNTFIVGEHARLDHYALLAEYSAKLAAHLGMTSVAVNLQMHVEGMRQLKKNEG